MRVVAMALSFFLFWVSLHLVTSGCPLEEKAALLELRASLVRSNCTPPASWEEKNECCLWQGVVCSNGTPRRVTALHLSNLAVYETGDGEYFKNWQLNLSIFRAFHTLGYLDLSYNRIGGSVASQGKIRDFFYVPSLRVLNLDGNNFGGSFLVEVLGGLPQLRELHLARNNFNRSLPLSLGKHSTIQHIDLSQNDLRGSIRLQAFSGLTSLQYLDLSENSLEGCTLNCSLSSLQVLKLDSNNLSGSFPVEVLTGLPQLHELYLRWNKLNGSLHLSLGNHSTIQHIDLSQNHLRGGIPPQALSGLTSLQYLDLSENVLEDNIPKQAFSNLTSLECLSLSDNHFHGDFPLPSLANLSRLKEITLSRNSRLGLETNFQHLVPTFQLRAFAMSSCNLSTTFLTDTNFLSSQHRLELVDLSDNNLSGILPSWFFKNYTKLSFARLRNNSLTGEIHLPTRPMSSMQTIDLSMNHLGGSLPPNFGIVFPNLSWLNLSTNHLVGKILSSFVNMSELETIDLSYNHFSGQIPPRLASDCPRLWFLKLSKNDLQGRIPRILPSISYLDGNKLTGTIPSNLSIDPFFGLLDLHDNQLSGNLPDSIGGIPSLSILNLRENQFHGPIPPHLCELSSLRILDLSNNSFSGAIPSCSVPLHLVYLNLGGNAFQGPFPPSFANSSELLSLNVINNRLSGTLISWFTELQHIRVLLLSHNQFEGTIPTLLCKLEGLQLLDLSHNDLSGRIPPCLLNMASKNMTEDFPEIWNFGGGSLFEAPFFASDLSLLVKADIGQLDFVVSTTLDEVEFSTKGNSYTFEKDLLSLMIGMDLSSNRLTGGIPPEIGNLTAVKALHFSHNQLNGSIPGTFSNLKQIESLDLSHNHLSGTIPWQLTELKSLEVFSVAYNNLSGCTPEWKPQFDTFNAESYVGNSGLHGPPLDKSCVSGSSPTNASQEQEKDDEGRNSMDDIILYAISVASFVLFFWSTVTVLHLSQTGRRVCLDMADRILKGTTDWRSLLANNMKRRRK